MRPLLQVTRQAEAIHVAERRDHYTCQEGRGQGEESKLTFLKIIVRYDFEYLCIFNIFHKLCQKLKQLFFLFSKIYILQ